MTGRDVPGRPHPATATWAEFVAAEPDLAALVRERLDAHRHGILGTLRADGSPRLSGVEVTFLDEDLWIGGMPGSRKFADLRRDPRLAVHSGSDDPPGFRGDARVSGRAVFEEDEAMKARFLEAAGGGPPGPFELVRVAITEISTVEEAPSRDHLVLSVWRPGAAVRRIARW